MLIDLRSDTVTQPTQGMLSAMQEAKVGDDVFGEDPSVNLLEQMCAELFGMEAGLYCVSGTMSNQLAIKAHTQPGDEVICEEKSHIYQYEGGGIASNAGCQVKLIKGDRGRIRAEQIKEAINEDDVHKARTSLVCLENTSNRGGGSCYELEEIKKIKDICAENGLMFHLDGARLFNAMVATDQPPGVYGALFNSISICMNKGLGCPMGSILLGPFSFIKKARRLRKAFGGGLRQAGYMAATAIYALENHIDRLAEDHRHAKLTETALRKNKFIGAVMPVETNLIIFEPVAGYSPKQVVEYLDSHDILALQISPHQVRLVFHLGITHPMAHRVEKIIEDLNL